MKKIKLLYYLRLITLLIGIGFLVLLIILLFLTDNQSLKNKIIDALIIASITGIIGFITSVTRSREKKYFDYVNKHITKDSLKKTSYNLYKRGFEFLYSKKFDECIHYFKELNEKTPATGFTYHICLIDIMIYNKNIETSIEILENIIADNKIRNDFGDFFHVLSKAYGKAGKISKESYYDEYANYGTKFFFK